MLVKDLGGTTDRPRAAGMIRFVATRATSTRASTATARAAGIAPALGTAFVAAGCGGGDLYAGLPRCSQKPASPISTRTAQRVLRAGGFTVDSPERSAECSGGNPVAVLDNMLIPVSKEEFIECFVYRTRIASKPRTVEVDAVATPLTLVFENIACRLIPRVSDAAGRAELAPILRRMTT